MKHPILVLAGVLWAGLGLGLAWAAGAQPPPMVDAHSHYTAADARALGPAGVIARLDEAGVSRAVISGTPGSLAQDLRAHAPERIIPLLGVYATDADKATWMWDPHLPARVAAELASRKWAGIGELHLFAQAAHSDVFAQLVRMAAQHRLVVLLHGDAEVVDRAFQLAPDLRVLWAHLGTQPLPETVGAVLERHAQRALWIDTSVRDDRIAPDGQLLPAWRALFEAHPERFVVAIDAFSTHRWSRYGEVARQIRQWTDPLPPALRERLLRLNAEALFESWTRP
jgi:predicted TIM-barrel fold metal-dependent hydrolase